MNAQVKACKIFMAYNHTTDASPTLYKGEWVNVVGGFPNTSWGRRLVLRVGRPILSFDGKNWTPHPIFADKFNGRSDFVMRRRKMKVVLVQNKIAPAICTPDKYLEFWTGEILAEKLGDAHNCLTLHLKDNVLREINETDNAYEIWTKLENFI
ncbi:hypothetical protein M9H77_21662 [Catharanthus roseus]|uniref:Uncharacterized protein n=1 Tax=Catharanthus roseus TaxID=4058 RepID=A0ACC0AQA1_CATRO|nr:hypothetical protein M9H77_21662 [Catharanthus roseus]